MLAACSLSPSYAQNCVNGNVCATPGEIYTEGDLGDKIDFDDPRLLDFRPLLAPLSLTCGDLVGILKSGKIPQDLLDSIPEGTDPPNLGAICTITLLLVAEQGVCGCAPTPPPTPRPTPLPTPRPTTPLPTPNPTPLPTPKPTERTTPAPSPSPTNIPTTQLPSEFPSEFPSTSVSPTPDVTNPSDSTKGPTFGTEDSVITSSSVPSDGPSLVPSLVPSDSPSLIPGITPTKALLMFAPYSVEFGAYVQGCATGNSSIDLNATCGGSGELSLLIENTIEDGQEGACEIGGDLGNTVLCSADGGQSSFVYPICHGYTREDLTLLVTVEPKGSHRCDDLLAEEDVLKDYGGLSAVFVSSNRLTCEGKANITLLDLDLIACGSGSTIFEVDELDQPVCADVQECESTVVVAGCFDDGECFEDGDPFCDVQHGIFETEIEYGETACPTTI